MKEIVDPRIVANRTQNLLLATQSGDGRTERIAASSQGLPLELIGGRQVIKRSSSQAQIPGIQAPVMDPDLLRLRVVLELDGQQSKACQIRAQAGRGAKIGAAQDRKSTRLNSSHANISYAVFC